MWGGLLGNLDGYFWGLLRLSGGCGVAGKAARSRVGETPRYGSENSTIAGALKITRAVRRECEAALAGLAYVERLEAQARARVEEEEAGGMGDACYCQCRETRTVVGGLTMEDAVELSDDDDVEILAVTFGQQPILPKNQPPINEPVDHEVIDGALLTAEDISGHQKNQKIRGFGDDVEEPENSPTEEAQTDKESCTSIDGEAALKVVDALNKDIKSVLKKLQIKPRALKAKRSALKAKPSARKAVKVQQNATPGKGGRGIERNVVDDEGEEDLEEHMYGSPRHKKSREVKYAQSDEDEPDYEVRVDSDSDTDPTPEVEDPLDDVWKECAVMYRLV